jgi:thiamine-phosphate pyrophosphorylase
MRELPSPAVQLITGRWDGPDDLRRRVEAALHGGIRWVQLRAKERSARELHDAASVLAPVCREAGALFVVNDRTDVAIACGADGVHLPEHGLASAEARRLLGPDAWVARSVHSVAAVRHVAPGELDALQFGPVFSTDSKRAYGLPLGIDELSHAAVAVRDGCRAWLVAVGGISEQSRALVTRSGADAVSVIGAIWDAVDVEEAAREMIRAAHCT